MRAPDRSVVRRKEADVELRGPVLVAIDLSDAADAAL
jgi:hypothetical protein